MNVHFIKNCFKHGPNSRFYLLWVFLLREGAKDLKNTEFRNLACQKGHGPCRDIGNPHGDAINKLDTRNQCLVVIVSEFDPSFCFLLHLIAKALIVFATTSWGGFLIPTFSVIVPDWAKVSSPKVPHKKMEQRITKKVVRCIKVILFIPTPPSRIS